MRRYLPRLRQLRLRENQLFLVLTIVIGVLAALSAVLFTVAIEQTTHRLFGLAPSRTRLFIVPPIISLVTGILLTRYFTDSRGSGVPQTKAAYHLAGGVIRARTPFGKFITGVLTIGAGHSMGREGPSVQIGAGLASIIGRWLQLRPRLVQRLIPVGAAAALAAAFNTPIAAVVFVLEEIIGDLNAAVLGSTIVASVTAVVVERSILGSDPLFHVPAYHLVHPAELIAYAALGIVGGLLSLLFSKGLLTTRGKLYSLPHSTRMFHPVLGGVAIGGLIAYAPDVMGVGYEYVDQALNGGLLFHTMLALCFLKLLATVISYASGNAGGIFAPTLYMGAMAGGAIGWGVHQYAPFPTADAGAYALVGMGALFAGIIRAPLTSVFMIFEVTQDYQIIVPLMIANVLSYTISKRYQPVPIYEALLEQDGVHLPSPGERGVTAGRAARHLMQTDLSFVPRDATLEQAAAVAAQSDLPELLVGKPECLDGFVSREALMEALSGGRQAESVSSLLNERNVHVHPDHSIDLVLQRFSQTGGVLPVVSRSDIKRIEGIITIGSIVQFLGRRAQTSSAARSDPESNDK